MPRQSRQIPLLPMNNTDGQMFVLTGRPRSSQAFPQQTAGHPMALRSHNAALSHPENHSPPRGHTCQTTYCSEHKNSWGRFQSLPPPLELAFAKQHCRSGDLREHLRSTESGVAEDTTEACALDSRPSPGSRPSPRMPTLLLFLHTHIGSRAVSLCIRQMSGYGWSMVSPVWSKQTLGL